MPYLKRNVSLYIKLIRPKQWIKQVLVILPLVLVVREVTLSSILQSLIAASTFTFASASIYVFNDLNDADSDKKDSAKKSRPIASGLISQSNAKIFFVLLILFTVIGIEFLQRSKFTFLIIAFYLLINICYSKFRLKNHSTLGIAIVALGFPLRFAVGTEVLESPHSFWAYVLITELALVMLAGKRFQTQQRGKVAVDKKSERSDHDFWLLALVIYSALFITTYSAFISQATIQMTWGRDPLLISTILIGLGLARFVEIATHPSKLLLEDVTDSFIRDRTLQLISLTYIFIMLLGFFHQ